MARAIRMRNQVLQNLKLWLENQLLQNGYYNNISVGQSDNRGNDLSALTPYANWNFSTAQYWQTALNNWVYESGIAPASGIEAPILPSGVWVNGVFKNQSDPIYGHTYDFINGAVVFGSGISTSDVIQIQYAAKQINVGFVNRDIILQLNELLNNVESFDKRYVSPSGQIRYIPGVYLQARSISFEPLQLGGGQIGKPQINFHIIHDNRWDGADIGDMILYKKEKHINLVDWNTAPSPLNEFGYYSPNHIPYTTIINDSTYWYHRQSWLEEVEALNVPDDDRIFYRETITCRMRIQAAQI